METLVYWLLVVGYYLLGTVAGLLLIGLFYPPIRTFPKTLMLVFGRILKPTAIVNLIWAMIFPLILLSLGYFLLNLLTPAYDVIKSRSFLVGLLGTILITLFNGGFRRANLSADYSDFMEKHSAIPEGVSALHLMIAAAVLQYSASNYDDPLHKQKGDKITDLIKSLEFNEEDEDMLVTAMTHLSVPNDDIVFAIDLYNIEREYVEWQRQNEIEKLEDERKEREFEELQKLEDEEFEKQMKEWKEQEGLDEED